MASKTFVFLVLVAATTIVSGKRCPANEVFAKCVDAVCWKTCDHLRTKPPCAAIADCNKPACVCKEGFLRNKRGICVPIDNCPAAPSVPNTPRCRANEMFVRCADAVCWQKCTHLWTQPACAAIADCDKPACVCRDGFLRNNRGVCIPTDDCPEAIPYEPDMPQCPDREVFAKCAEAVCWTTCEHLKTRPPCAAIADCDNPTCVCKDGYLRNSRGICVPHEKCFY